MSQNEMDEVDEKRHAEGLADPPADLASAVRVCLAPLKSGHAFDGAVEYVLHGTGPEVLDVLCDSRSAGWADMVSRGGAWSDDRVAAVAARQPGWSTEAADASRLVVYGHAPAEVLARFGHLLGAVGAPEDGDRPVAATWLTLLTDNVVDATASRSAASEAARARWTPDLLCAVARAGRAPGRTPVHATLMTLLHEPGIRGNRRQALLATEAGDAFLARHTDVLTEVVTAPDFGARRFVTLRCARDAERHAGLLAALATDEDRGVRADALAALAWLDGPRQTEVLRPHLRTAPPDRLAGVLGRLADIDGGAAAIRDALKATEGQPLGVERAESLRRTADRMSLPKGPGATVPVPPTVPPTDADLLAELATRPAAARLEGDCFWPGVQQWLARLPDVRVLRDALREAGTTDADRRVAALLTTRSTGAFGRPIGTVLTAEDAERWWPLFAERPDLVAEYLEGFDTKRHPDDEAVDTTHMMLRILERFPAVPDVLAPDLTSLALGASRHRLAARRVLGDHPGARTAARAALDGAEETARSSAAEWLAARGEPGVMPPEPGWEFGDGVLAPATRTLPAATLWWLDRFRTQALERGVPAPDVNRWLGLARPMLRTAPDGGGPVVGRLGGPLMLPPDVPTPGDTYELVGEEGTEYTADHQLILTLDFSAVPEGATDLPLPPDGTLLLFVNADLEPWPAGGAVYVPAGAAVEERESSPDYEVYEYDTPEELDAELRRVGALRLVPGVSLPSTPPDDGMLARHPHAETLREVWAEQTDGGGDWQLGGHAANFDDYGDPVAGSADPEASEELADPDDWVLLAQWVGFPMSILYWTIPRQDLAARRFDRVAVQMHANP
ncbi:YwqG family protein [Streptomyces sp. ICN988]|uniref:YwqG family protein n=1 Tax=Streptomyces sp. ICN988 TaxID=2983765 RepID=UPI0021E3FBB0|nr:YwqG family protein [Streptomyces sp. ICN988]MCV2457925.1 YwqG family protein [Streptomyces sp. ICN988]